MSAIYEALEKATLVSDGAMGTMLQDRGLTAVSYTHLTLPTTPYV